MKETYARREPARLKGRGGKSKGETTEEEEWSRDNIGKWQKGPEAQGRERGR